MARSFALILALLATTALVPLSAEAQPAPVPVQLYLSSIPATFGTLSNVETLSSAPPTKADDSLRNLTGGAAWYAPPGSIAGTTGEAGFDSGVAGSAFIQTTPVAPLPIGVTFQSTVTFGLFKLSANGTAVFLSNTTAEQQFTSPLSNTTQVNFTMPRPSATLLPGEALFLNVSATATVGSIAMQYDSAAHPSGLNFTLLPVARGNLQLSATTTSRDAAPGSSPTFVVSVRNLAPDQDAVRLNATGIPADYTVRVNPTQLTLAGGSSGSVLITVTVPASAADGARHTATVTAESGNGGTPQTLTLTTNVRVAAGTPGDTDGDGTTDVDERRYSSDPNDRNSTPDNTDSDGDGVSNRAEVDAGTDPFDPNDFPGAGTSPGGGFGGGSGSALAPLSDPIAQALGVDSTTADILAILLILLFLLIILLLIWFLFLGYPVAVSLVEPRAATEPGRGADYAVEVKSRLGRSQQVDLEAAGLPGDWDVRFNKPQFTLDAKQSEVVGMLVRPPGGWPAPSKRDFEVRARSRLKPGKFAKAIAKLIINPRGAAVPEAPQEEALPEPAEAWQAEREPVPVPYVVPVPSGEAGPAFKVSIHDVRHTPAVPERGAEVTTTARVDNSGTTQERLRVVLVVNGKVRDEVQVELAPGEGAEAEFHWVAYLARNEVKVVAERA